MSEVVYRVGNTYHKLPEQRAKLDRTGKHKKIHDFILYVDVLKGNPDHIMRVVFDLGASYQPRSFTCSCPINVTRPDGRQAWRFSTRQQSYGAVTASITILGTNNTRNDLSYTTVLTQAANNNTTGNNKVFVERETPRPLPMLKIDPGQNFGIELELTASSTKTLETIAASLTNKLKGRMGRITVIRDYRESRVTTEVWKIVPDSSVVCGRNLPNCNTFELVSPILAGGHGLNQAAQVLEALSKISNSSSLQVNKSAGFHCHVDVSALSLAQLIKVCQNCIKYEDVIDALLPPSRRTGSHECDTYFKSNYRAMHALGFSTNERRHKALGACRSKEALAALMNPNQSRYHKINLQNLVTGRQPTIEFRQHSATSNGRKVNSWVRFCITMVVNSARLKAPTSFNESRDLNFQFDALFQFVVKDRALRDYYRGRRDAVGGEGEDDDCCQGCSSGRGSCAAHRVAGRKRAL